MTALLLVALSMAARDALSTFLVIAENRERVWLAGACDALGDLATVICTAYGAGEIILHGWDGRALEILTVMVATSFFGTALWTRLGRNIKGTPPILGVK